MDELDTRLLKLLSEESITRLTHIARRLETPEATVRYRIKRLIKRGVIRSFRAIIDPRYLGLDHVAFVALTVKPWFMRNVAAALTTIQNVTGIYETHTYGDLLIKMNVSNQAALSDVITNKIKTIKGIVATQVVPVLSVWKDTYT